jgi:hypothetical protein
VFPLCDVAVVLVHQRRVGVHDAVLHQFPQGEHVSRVVELFEPTLAETERAELG